MTYRPPARQPIPQMMPNYSRDLVDAGFLAVERRLTAVERLSDSREVADEPVAITATADGSGTGTLPNRRKTIATVSVTTDANDIVILPSPAVGREVTLISGGTGFELRSSDPATIAINGGTGAGAESAIPASTLVRCICTSSTTWLCTNQASNGALSATQVAA